MLPKTVVFFLLVAWITDSTLAQSTKCPQKGKIGAPLPDIFQGINPDVGYHIVVKMAGDDYPLTKVDEYYNGATKHGRIQINDGDGFRGISYYSMTNKIFTLDEEKRCEAKQINATEKESIVNSWLKSDDLIEALSTYFQIDDLSPGALLMYVNSIKDKFQDLSGNGAMVDGQQVNQWFYCINDDGPYIEFNFNKLNQPTNMVLILPDSPETTRTIYFISMEPAIPGKDEPILYPWGLRCLRRKENSRVVVPKFARSDVFFMEMEASLFFSSDNVSVLGNAKVTKYQGIYSYDLISGNQTTRIIRDSLVGVDYRVDPLNGKCTEKSAPSSWSSRMSSLRWPYAEEGMFNLLDENLFELDFIQRRYMGQIHTDFGRMDIFERKANNFFKDDEGMYYAALLTYLFPIKEAVRERHQAPLKIIITPMTNYTEDDATFLAKVELMFKDYREKNIGDTDLHVFDISGCYDEPGRYTWFQIVFPDIPSNILQWGAEAELIRSSFDKAISLFIPRVRLPETRISFFGPNIYVTSKLLQRPAPKYFFDSVNDTLLAFPTETLVLENEEECGKICSEDENCNGFSYCSNRECRISSFTSRFYPDYKEGVGCTLYNPKYFSYDGATTVEKNLRKSSKTLLQEMKLLIGKGKFYLDSPPISAEKIVIVNGPDDIGGMDIEIDEDIQVTTTNSHSNWS